MEKTLGYNEVTWSLGFIQEKWTFSQQTILVGGCIPTPLKNMNINWDDEIPNISGKKNVPNHQPESIDLQRDLSSGHGYTWLENPQSMDVSSWEKWRMVAMFDYQRV